MADSSQKLRSYRCSYHRHVLNTEAPVFLHNSFLKKLACFFHHIAHQQRQRGEKGADIQDGRVLTANLDAGAEALVQQLHHGGLGYRLAVHCGGEALLLALGRFLAAVFLEAAVALQIDQGAGDIAVVIIQKGNGFLVGDTALAADEFDVFDGVGGHGEYPFQIVWFAC